MAFRDFWWLIFPIAGMTFGFVITISVMMLKHRRRLAAMELLKTYVTQGKEPPSEILKTLDLCGAKIPGPLRAWKRALTLSAVSLGLAVSYYVLRLQGMSFGPAHPLLVGAIIVGALAIGAIAFALLQGKLEKK